MFRSQKYFLSVRNYATPQAGCCSISVVSTYIIALAGPDTNLQNSVYYRPCVIRGPNITRFFVPDGPRDNEGALYYFCITLPEVFFVHLSIRCSYFQFLLHGQVPYYSRVIIFSYQLLMLFFLKYINLRFNTLKQHNISVY